MSTSAHAPAVLAGMVRGIPAEELGRLVADLPDEDLAVIARSILELFMREGRGAPRRTATRRPTEKLRKELASRARGAGRAEANGHAPAISDREQKQLELLERVYKLVISADDGISSTEVAKALKCSGASAGRLLSKLREADRVFCSEGAPRYARWAVTQDAAQEAYDAARGAST